MQYSRNEVITGATVLVSIALFVILLLALGNFSTWFKKTFTVYVYFNDIGYLSNHTKVLQAGVPVGTVVAIEHVKPGEKITFADGKIESPSVRVTLRLDEGTHVSKASKIYIDTKGLLGEPFVAIAKGPATPLQELKPEEALRGMDSASLVLVMNEVSGILRDMHLEALDVKALQHKVSEVLESATGLLNLTSTKVDQLDVPRIQNGLIDVARKAGDLVDSATALLEGATTQRIFANLKGMTGNFNVVSASFSADYNKLRDGIIQVVSLSRDLLDNVNQLVSGNRENIDGLLVNLRGTAEKLNQNLEPLLVSARSLLSRLDGVVGDNKMNLDETFKNLREFTANAEEFSRILAESPWRLLWKTDKRRSPYDEAPEWVESPTEMAGAATGAAVGADIASPTP